MSLATPAGRGRDREASGLGCLLALSACAGLAVYCALSFCLGPAGLAAYARLESRKAAMEANLSRLADLRGSLDADLLSLKSDPDRAAREARGLGYLRKGETILVLEGRKDEVAQPDTGTVLPYAQPEALSDESLKCIAVGAALTVLALLLAPRRQGKRSGGVAYR